MRRTVYATKSSAEIWDIPSDFTGEMSAGVTISSAVVHIFSIPRGEDTNPSTMLAGSPSVNGETIVQRIEAGIPNVSYEIFYYATGSDGEEYENIVVLPISGVTEAG